MKYPILLFIISISVFSHAGAAKYYVSSNGSGNSCTEELPCGSIQTAIDLANPGDTVKLAAGTYIENVKLGSPQAPNAKPGITIKGKGAEKTVIISAGTNTQRPAGVAADIVFDIWSANTVIEKLSIQHPATVVSARDIGIFVGPPAINTIIRKCKIIRKRLGPNLEPTEPGSRGLLVFRATGSIIRRNSFKGNYEDHIHMPTSDSEISRNKVKGATRLGIVIIQETASSNNTNNSVTRNKVSNSGGDGIQIQGDNNIVLKNKIKNSGGAAIKLCGETDGNNTLGDGDCVNPFDKWADASGNTVLKNSFKGNAINGIVDNGQNNTIDDD